MHKCKMTNPLIEKYNELYNPKPPEPPKPVEKPKSVKLKSYDPDSVNVSFQQVAEKVKNGEAQVSSMSMEMDIMSGTKITFEVYVYGP
jgi:hypothetical protein